MDLKDKSILEYDYINLIVNFNDVSEFIRHELGLRKSNKTIIDLVSYFILLTFTPYSKEEEKSLSEYIYAIDVLMNKLFPDEEEREDKFQEIRDKIIDIIKEYIPLYTKYKEIDKAFVGIRKLNKLEFILTIECRIARYGWQS